LGIILELVNKLVDDVPEPLVREFQLDGLIVFGVKDVVENLAIVVKGVRSILVAWSVLEHVDMSEIKFL